MKTLSRYYTAACMVILSVVEPTNLETAKWYFIVMLPNIVLSLILLKKYGELKQYSDYEK